MPDFININGKLLPTDEAGIAAANRAFRYGYGLIETMLVCDGAIRLDHYHWDRLFSGLDLLRIGYPMHFREELAREVWRTVQKNKREEIGRIRLQVYGGNGGFYDGDDFDARYVIETFPLEKTVLALNENGLVAGVSDVIKHTGAFAHLKTSNALPYILAARQAKAALWNDALLLNEHGNVVESTIANIFCIKEQIVFTPPLSQGCVSGVMRAYLLEILPRLGYKVVEQPLQVDDFRTHDGVFLCNAVRGVRWIKQVGAHIFQRETVGYLWRAIASM